MEIPIPKTTTQQDVYDFQFDKALYRVPLTQEFGVDNPVVYDQFSQTTSALLTGGSMSGVYNLVDGNMQSGNFVTGSTGWQILSNGSCEFSDGTFRGILVAAEIHIPDVDTTASSFHTNTTGNSWWGCTETDFNSDNDNANAYILSTGEGKLQNTLMTGTSTIELGSSTNILKANNSDGIWLGHGTFASAPFSVSSAGAIKAVSGTIATWTIITDYIYKLASGTPASSPSDGLVLDGGSTPTISVYENTELRLELGYLSAGIYGLKGYDDDGATVLFEISDTQKVISGWNIVDGYIYNLQSGTPTSSPSDGIVIASGNEGIIVYEDTAKRAEVGYLSAGVYGFKAYDTGGSNVVFEVSDTQQKMAGWYFTTTTLADNATAASANVLIDSANSLIRLGPTAGTTISIDGANQKIESEDYVSGFAGAGFHLSAALLEVGNIACRGIIRTAVFQKDVISVVGGNVAILDADVLATDMDATDAETLTIEGNTTFVNNDILRIKDGTDDEWMTVTNASGAPTYVVTRDGGTDYAADTNPTWKKGAAVVNYGASGEGGVYMTASETNAPYLSVFTHAGAPWTTITTWLRIGNLNGYLGYSSDLFGIAIGEATKYLKYETTNGLVIRGDITADAGYIGGSSGWVIASGKITSTGIGVATTTGDATYAFWAGDDTPASAEFSVSHAGALVATSATITGTVTATDGAIGGWTLSVNAIYLDTGTDATSSGMASGDYPFYAGKEYASRATAPFRVTNAGALVATGATITGVITVSATSSGIASFSDAGNLVTVNEADVDQTALTNSAAAGATVGAVFGTNITGGGGGDGQVSNAGYVTTISDSLITVTNLAAINADLGSITAGNMTLDSSGYIKGGQTAFDTGAGFFLGYDTTAYKYSIGDGAGNKATWDGSDFTIWGGVNARDLKTYKIHATDEYHANDASRGIDQSTYTKEKQITLGSGWPKTTIRVHFGLCSNGGADFVFGRIYKNGVAHGTERSTNNICPGGGQPAVTFEEDLVFESGDTVEVWCKKGAAGGGGVMQLRILGNLDLTQFDTTSADP